MNNETFVYVTYIAAKPEQVWDALLEGELARQYWGHEVVPETSLKEGSPWKLVANDGKKTVKQVGKVLEMVTGKRLVLSWADPADIADAAKHTRVALDIEPLDDKVRLTVTHDQLTDTMRPRISKGWPLVLASMKSFLETGRPLSLKM